MSSLPTVPSGTSNAKRPPSLLARRHVRGDLLRRSLYYTFIAWIPGAFWMGATGATSMTKLGEFLGANDLIFAIIFTAGPMLAVLWQLPGYLTVEYFQHRKGPFLWTGVPCRFLFLVMGLLPWFLPSHDLRSASVLAGLVFVAMSLHNFSAQAWVNWMADLVPTRLRGKFFAARSRMGVAIIAASTILVAFILDIANSPRVVEVLKPFHPEWMPPLYFLISLVFIAAGAIGMLDILAFTKVIDPPMQPPTREPLLQRLARPMKDKQFRRFVTYFSVWQAANNWCAWLWMVYVLTFMQEQLTLADKTGVRPWWDGYMFLAAAVILPVGYQIGQFLGFPIWGRAVDRFGRKPVFLVSSAMHTISWLFWIFLSPSMLPWLLVTQVFGGLFGGGMDIASLNMMLYFNRKGGAGYQSIGSIIFSTAGAIAGIAAGALSTALVDWKWTLGAGTPYEHTFNRYALLIVIGAIIKYTADFVFLPRVHDVDAKPAGHAFRYMLTNVHDTIESLIFVPIRRSARATGTSLRRWWR
jgi:MFS family permease